MKRIGWALFCCIFAGVVPVTFAATDINHSAIGYFVPEKRIRLEAGVSDPRGIKLTRTYFKFGPQADYLLVPMEAAGSNRYAASLPAPSTATESIEYLFLAVNNDGQVARTDAYTVKVRKTGETPAWQNVRADGNIKVFTEVPTAPMPTTAFADSVTMDLVESGARFGAVAGLASGSSAAGGSAAGTTTTTTTTATAGVGGLSTAAIIGGVVVAGAAAAAAGGGGGGGGGDSGASPYAGSWSGTENALMSFTCSSSTFNGSCTIIDPFTVTVTSAGAASFLDTTPGVVTCTNPALGSFGQALAPASPFSVNIPSNGVITLPGSTISQSGVTVNCAAGNLTFAVNPRRIVGSQSCSGSSAPSLGGCSFSFTMNFTGS